MCLHILDFQDVFRKYTCILLNMAILPSIDNNTRKRELTDKQEAFLQHLVETQGDAREAAKLAGYSSHYHHQCQCHGLGA